MSKKCKITGKGPLSGNRVSHANNKVKRRQLPNLQSRKMFIPELGRKVRLRLSTSAIRTIDKYGLMPYLKKNGLTLKDIM